MTEQSSRPDKKAEHDRRAAEALRANLRRRKAQKAPSPKDDGRDPPDATDQT